MNKWGIVFNCSSDQRDGVEGLKVWGSQGQSLWFKVLSPFRLFFASVVACMGVSAFLQGWFCDFQSQNSWFLYCVVLRTLCPAKFMASQNSCFLTVWFREPRVFTKFMVSWPSFKADFATCVVHECHSLASFLQGWFSHLYGLANLMVSLNS